MKGDQNKFFGIKISNSKLLVTEDLGNTFGANRKHVEQMDWHPAKPTAVFKILFLKHDFRKPELWSF